MADLTLRYLLFGEDKTASKTVKGVGDEAENTARRVGGAVSRIGSAIGGDMGEILGRVGDGLDAAGGKSASNAQKLGMVGGVALASGLALQAMASGDVEAQNKLANAIANTGGAYDDYAERVDAAVESSVKFGVTDGEVKDALTKLTDATKDPTKALDDLALAHDLASAKGVGLAEAASMVGKAHNGAGKLFKEFGVVVGENADGSKDFEGALSDLAGTLKGRAEANADSFGGKLRELKAWTDNAASSFAEQYGPAITMAGAAMSGLAAVTELASLANVKNAASTVAAKAAQIGSAVATGVATAAQWAWNVALNANPIGLIIVAIAAFVAAILWLWNNVDWFREGVTKAWEAIKTGWSWLWDNVLKPGFEAWAAVMNWLWNSVIAPVIRFVLEGFANITRGIATFLDALSNIPVFDWARDAAEKMRGAATWAEGLAKNIRDIPKSVSVDVVVGYRITGSIQAAQDARLARVEGARAGGGPVTQGRTYLVGEHGPELWVAERSGTILDAQSTARVLAGAPGAALGVPHSATSAVATPPPAPSASSIGSEVAAALRGMSIRLDRVSTVGDYVVGTLVSTLEREPGVAW